MEAIRAPRNTITNIDTPTTHHHRTPRLFRNRWSGVRRSAAPNVDTTMPTTTTTTITTTTTAIGPTSLSIAAHTTVITSTATICRTTTTCSTRTRIATSTSTATSTPTPSLTTLCLLEKVGQGGSSLSSGGQSGGINFEQFRVQFATVTPEGTQNLLHVWKLSWVVDLVKRSPREEEVHENKRKRKSPSKRKKKKKENEVRKEQTMFEESHKMC